MGDDLAAKREEERLMRAFGGAKSPRVFKPAAPAASAAPATAAKPAAAAAAPKPAAAPAVAKPAADPAPAAAAAPSAAAAPAAASAPAGGAAAAPSATPARPGPAFPKGKPAAVAVATTAPPTLKQGALETGQVAPTNLGGGGNVYTSAKIPTLRGRKDVARGLQIWQGKMLDDDAKLRLAQDGGYTGLEQLLQHNALDVRNLAKEAVLQLETAPGTGDIGTFTADKLSPLVKLFTTTDNILVRQLALWDLATMASVPESRKAIIEKFGLDVVVKLVTDPETEIAAAACTLLGNLSQDDADRALIFKEEALAHVMALGKDRKDPKAICAVSFALGNFSLDEAHAHRVVDAGGLAWVLQQLSSGDPEILRTAWGAISTLAKYAFARQEILNAGGLKSLVHILKTTKDDLTFQYATQAVVNLCLDPAIAEKYIQEGGLLALERVNDDSFDLLCHKTGLVKKPTPSVWAVQLRVASSYRNIAKANAACRNQLRARKDSVAIVRSLARSDQEKIAVVAKEALALLEDDADAKAREAAEAEAKAKADAEAKARALKLLESRAAAEAEEARKKALVEEEARKKVAAEEEVRRQKAQVAEEERKRATAAEEERKRATAAMEEAQKKAAEAEALRKKAAEAAEEARKKAAAEEEARRKAAAEEEARKKNAAAEEARRKADEEARRKLAEEERKRKEEADAREAKLKADLEAERKRLEAERKEAYDKERKAREEAEARARQLEEDRRRKEEELRLRLDKEDQERRDRWRKEEEERRRADEEARKRTEEEMRKLEDMQRRLAEERRRLDDARRAVETAAPVVVVKERAAGELPVEPIAAEAGKKEEAKKEEAAPVVYKIDRAVAKMLHGLDLSRFETNFAHNKITYDQLFSLRDSDLRAMGIDSVGPRARILQAINDLYADSLGRDGDAAMRRLINDLDSHDPNVLLDALERLLIVAERSPANRNALVVLELIPLLIALIRRSRYIEVQAGAVKVLGSLAQESRAQAEIRLAKGIEPVVYLANYESWREDLETLAHVLLLLKRLTSDAENKRLLREANFMPQIVHVIAKDEQPAVRALALDLLAIITVEDRANQEALWNTNMALNYINAALQSNDVEVKEAATRAIGALAGGAFAPFQELIWTVPYGIPARLVDLTRLDGEETLQAAATLALAYLSEDNAPHASYVVAEGVVRRTTPLLRAKNQNARVVAAAAIRILSRGNRVRSSVAQAVNHACVIGPLAELAAFSPSLDVRREALGALFELSKESSTIQKLVYTSLGPQPLIKGLKSGVPVVQYYSGGIFYNAARGRADVVYEMNTAGVEPLVRQLLESTDYNLRLGAEALDDMLRDITAPGPITATALAQ